MSVKLGSFVCIESAGAAAASSRPPASDDREHRAAQHAVEHEAPEARLAGRLLAAAEVRHAAPIDTVAELREHRGQHRQRADHRAEGRRASSRSPSPVKIRLPAMNMPGHRDQHGRARDQHGLTGGRGGAEQRRTAAPARAPAPRARGGGRRASSRRRPPCRSGGSRAEVDW